MHNTSLYILTYYTYNSIIGVCFPHLIHIAFITLYLDNISSEYDISNLLQGHYSNLRILYLLYLHVSLCIVPKCYYHFACDI